MKRQSADVSYTRVRSYSIERDTLAIAISAAVEDSIVGISNTLKRDMQDAAKAAEDALKSVSPYRRGSGRGHYRSGWRHSIHESDWHYSAIVYNYNKPTLTHLLEHGHELMRWNRGRTEKRNIGYVDGTPHIRKGYEAASAYLKSRGW